MALGAAAPLPAQQNEEPPREIVVTAERHESAIFDTPRSINVVDEQELRRRNQAVALDSLQHEIGIWIEHRTGTSADPVIRGLGGGNILALVDGNTLSTFWGEGGFAGDDMYGKVDPWSLERIEVVRGPASVLYGSNALGGVINFITRRPPMDYTSSGSAWGGELRGAYGSNNDLRRERLDLWGANPWARWRIGGTLANFGDYRSGSGQLLTPTGGREGNLDLNSEYALSDQEFLEVNIQKVHRNPVFRYYRPTQSNRNDRTGVDLKLRSERPSTLWDQGFVRLYYQKKEDWRFFANGDRGVASWQTWTSDAQAHLDLGTHELTYGVAFQLDRGESPDDEQFTIFPAGGGPKQKAAPDSDWWNLGLYLQDRWDISETWSLLASARFDHFLFRSTPDRYYVPPAGSPPGVDDLRATQNSLTGGLALTRYLNEDLNVYLSWYRGFRQFAPNFGIRQQSVGILVPNGLLDPIHSDTFELGSKFEDSTLSVEAAAYFTDFSNFQNNVAGSWQGSQYYDYNHNGTFEANERVYQIVPDGDAYVRGIELNARARMDRFLDSPAAADWSVRGGFMWNIGQDRTNDVPMRNTPPARGLMEIAWEPQDASGDPFLVFDAEFVDAFTRIDPARLNSDVLYLNDPQDPNSGLVRPWGLPGYSVYSVRGGITLDNGVELTLALENLLDAHYRGAFSSADAMGRNFLLGVSVPF